MEVNLISCTQDPIETCMRCAAVCYNSKPSFKILKACIESGHTSVLEHANYTFEIKGVSRALLAQLTRHRIASYSVRSQRYCEEPFSEGDEPNFVVPNTVTSEEYDAYKEAMKRSFSTYEYLIAAGLPKEDARMVLPNACHTTIMMTINLRSLGNFMSERLCQRAQWEIRELAMKMKREILSTMTDEEADFFDLHWLVPKCRQHKLPMCEERNCCGYSPSINSYELNKEKRQNECRNK
jgi:thymidylate synthase (FAD)